MALAREPGEPRANLKSEGECVVNGGMDGKKTLGGSGGFEPPLPEPE
jgi:hypothetical protein